MAYTSRNKLSKYIKNLISTAGGFWSVDRVNAGSTLTLVNDTHAGKTILLNTATGSVVTLPAATGSNAEYTFVVSALATSNSHKIQVANASDIMVGVINTVDTDTSDAVGPFATTSTSDTITLTTTGSVRVGATIRLQDVATNRWEVRGTVFVTGTPATPFSAAV